MDAVTALITRIRAGFEGLRARLVTTLGRLSPEDLAWRANEESNSAANLVLHICGNLRQRFHAGFGGAADDRVRNEEFADRGPWSAEAMIARANTAFAEVDAFLAALDPARLEETRTIQGRAQTLLDMLLLTLPHVAEHVGQIIYIAKARQGEGFATLSLPLKKPERPGAS